MRARPVPILAGTFVAAALAAAFVIRQLPREGEVSLTAPGPTPAAPTAPATPSAERPATAADGLLEVRATAGGEPQANAEVQLYLQVAALPGAPPAWRRAGSGRTGADGIARVAAWPGDYLVAVRTPGLAPGRAEVVRAEGEEATRVEVALAPGTALSGTVSGPDGRPAAARVSLVPLPGELLAAEPSAPAEEVATTTAGADGTFRLEGLAPGLYALRADAPGLHPLLVARVAAPRAGPLALRLEAMATLSGAVTGEDGHPAAGASVRAVSPDHDAEVTTGPDGRFSLAAPSGAYQLVATRGGAAGALPGMVTVAPGGAAQELQLRLGRAAAIEGEAVRAGGAPAPGAQVALRRHGGAAVIARATAGADGRFAVGGLAPGAWDVWVAAPGLTPARAEGVTLGAGQRFPLRAALAGLGAVEGVVADPRGRPLANVRVRVVSRGDGLAAPAGPEARTDFEGRYQLRAVEAGRAELVAREQGAALGAARVARVVEGQTSRVDFSLAPAGLLTGRAVAGGRPPPLGTVVVAMPLQAGLGALQVARAVADASGNYQLHLPAGGYRVHAAPAEATGSELRVAPAFTRVDAGGTTRLDPAVAAVEEQDGLEILVLEPGGAPSPGAVVTVGRPGGARVALAARAGEDGRLRLAKDMGLAGRSAVVRARNGGRSGAFTGTLPASGTVAVTLSPGGAIQGRVRGGKAPSGFTLEVASQPTSDGWRTLDVHRFAGDRFELGDLPAEALRLTVRADDGRRGEAEVHLGAGESRTVEIALQGAARR